MQSLRERVGEGSKGFNHHPARASRGPSVQSTAEAWVDLDGSQPPPPACGDGGRGQGGVKGLCVGRPGLKSSYKETSSRSGEPVTQMPALGSAAAPPNTDGGAGTLTLPTSNCSPNNASGEPCSWPWRRQGPPSATSPCSGTSPRAFPTQPRLAELAGKHSPASPAGTHIWCFSY